MNKIHRITIVEEEADTEIQVNGEAIHSGSGPHTREALRNLTDSFARAIGIEVDYDIRCDDYYEEPSKW